MVSKIFRRHRHNSQQLRTWDAGAKERRGKFGLSERSGRRKVEAAAS